MNLDANAVSVNSPRHRFFEVACDVMTVMTLEGKFEDVNPAFTASLGWSLEELQGMPSLLLVHFGDHQSTAGELAKLRRGAASVSFENRYWTKERRGLKRFAWGVQLVDERFFAIGREVQEASLLTLRSAGVERASESDLLPNRIVYEGNPHTGEIRYGENIARLLGYQSSDLAGGFHSWRELVHPDDREAYEQTVTENLARKRAFHMDYRTVHRDGTAVHVQDVGQFRFDTSHNVTGVVGYVTPAIGWGCQTQVGRTTSYYHGLAECALALNSTRSLNEIHQVITDHARVIVGAHQSVTAITTNANFVMAVNALALSDKYAPWRDYAVVPDGSGIYAMICETNRAARMTQAELEAHPRWLGFGKERAAHPPMRGWLAAPLIGRDGNNLGLIQLSDKCEGEFDETDEAILVQLAKMAAVAIENAYLYRDIEAARNTLAESEERLRLAQAVAHMGSFEWNIQTNVNIWTTELEAIYGLPPGGFPGTQSAWEKLVHPEDRAGALRSVEQAFETKLPTEGEWRVLWPDGSVHWLAGRFQVFCDETGKPLRLTGVNIDISDRKQAEEQIQTLNRELEQRVQQRTVELAQANDALRQVHEELARSNVDLEQFAFAASHDLQEPMRAIAGYCQLLQRQYTGKLDAVADTYIKNVVEGVERMYMLIGNLLEFARVSHHGKPFHPTDFNVVLQEALAHLKTAVQESGTQVECGGLPVLRADKGQLIRLFQNLIGNAIKYRSPQPPEVRITAEEKPHEVLFSVRDNGIGIEARYFERIFVIFQRLHTREEYPGTGIGLAVCKRIVERHGGRIWVEPEPGKGSRFFFTISKHLGEHS